MSILYMVLYDIRLHLHIFFSYFFYNFVFITLLQKYIIIKSPFDATWLKVNGATISHIFAAKARLTLPPQTSTTQTKGDHGEHQNEYGHNHHAGHDDDLNGGNVAGKFPLMVDFEMRAKLLYM